MPTADTSEDMILAPRTATVECRVKGTTKLGLNIAAMVPELNIAVDHKREGANFDIIVRGVFRKSPACLTKNG